MSGRNSIPRDGAYVICFPAGCRLCIRLSPVQSVCHAGLQEIGAAARKLTAPHFPAGAGAQPVRFAVAYEHRASVELKRLDVINAVVDQIPQVCGLVLSSAPL